MEELFGINFVFKIRKNLVSCSAFEILKNLGCVNVPAKYDFIELFFHFPIIYPRVKRENFFYFKLMATSCVRSVVLSKNNQHTSRV